MSTITVTWEFFNIDHVWKVLKSVIKMMHCRIKVVALGAWLGTCKLRNLQMLSIHFEILINLIEEKYPSSTDQKLFQNLVTPDRKYWGKNKRNWSKTSLLVSILKLGTIHFLKPSPVVQSKNYFLFQKIYKIWG